MTRDEAVNAIHKAHHPEDHGYSTGKSMSNRHWAEKAVDGYVALGMLKLDEPKAPPSVLRKAEQALRVAIQVGSPDVQWTRSM